MNALIELRVNPWHARFMGMARFVATWSEHPVTQVGAVAVNSDHSVLGVGYNGMPRRVGYTPEREASPEKHLWWVHAEENTVYDAARKGASLLGAHMYTSAKPCSQPCARAIVQAGIYLVVYDAGNPYNDHDEKAQHEHGVALEIMMEAGVTVMPYVEAPK